MLNLVNLKYFHDVAQFGSFSAAAKANFVTRPAISQAVRALEATVGASLVIHGKGRCELTAKGKWLMSRARGLLLDAKRLEMELQTPEGQETESVSVCVSHSIALTFFPRALHTWRGAVPHAPLRLLVGNAAETRRLLKSREADVGLAVDDQQFSEFDTQVIREGRFVLVQSTMSTPVDALLVGDQGAEVEVLRKWLFQKTGTSGVSMEIKSWEIMAEFCSLGLGMAWIPDFLVQEGRFAHLQPIAGNFPDATYRLCAVALDLSRLSVGSRELVSHLSKR